MSLQEVDPNPPFRSMVTASGLAEVWTHTHENEKFKQFGWRCTNKESGYRNETLVGNWNEERFDNEKRKKAECLPSQYGHYFNPVYNSSYNTVPKEKVPEELKHLTGSHPHAFPHHQPEIDCPQLKAIYNSWKTTTRADYIDPRIRMKPVGPPPETTENKTAEPAAPQ